MIFDRLTLIRSRFMDRRAAAAATKRWAAADQRDPELARDIIRLSGILTKSPARFDGGVELPEPIDPIRMAVERGRRELGLELLAMMKISFDELSGLMETDDA